MTGQERTKEIRQLNETPLSQAAKPLVSKKYLEEHELILSAALCQYLDEAIPEADSVWKYQMQTAQEIMDGLEWMWKTADYQPKYSPKEIYDFLTTVEEEDDWREEQILEVIQTSEQGDWILGNLGQELMDSLEAWFRLSPEYPELL